MKHEEKIIFPTVWHNDLDNQAKLLHLLQWVSKKELCFDNSGSSYTMCGGEFGDFEFNTLEDLLNNYIKI